MKMAGSMHPPFRRGEIRFAPQPPDGDGCAALLCPSSPHKIFDFAGPPLLQKERMRRARWKRENGGAQAVPPVSRMSSARSVIQTGVLAADVRTVRPSPLPPTWRLGKELPLYRPPSSAARPSAHPSIDRPPYRGPRRSPAKRVRWGEEEGMEQSGVLAVRRGRSGWNFF